MLMKKRDSSTYLGNTNHLANYLIDVRDARDCFTVCRVSFVHLFLSQDCRWREITEGALFQFSSSSGRAQMLVAKVDNLLACPNLSKVGG